ncbi:uncharacterized protein LOC132609397 [Lycium barbarum]|uniref:uncharacterized protein LOC132609397 n=1 Tax=Lycium barbarum TaxID=112863 RepID=UPI00293F254E|nr:uncharacterized protein LOC132609397 [Lycium barbarum]
MGNVARELLTGILFCSDAHIVWQELKERFDRNEYDSIIPPRPCDCEKSAKSVENLQYQRILQFFMGLNEGYSQARSQILLKTQLPSVNQIYAMLVQDESQKMMTGSSYAAIEHIEPTTLFTARATVQRPRRNFNLVCNFCHMRGHTRDGCYKLMKCEFCGQKGHVKETCYKLIGYPADFKSKRKNGTTTSTSSGYMVQGENSCATGEHLTHNGSSNLRPIGKYMTHGESNGSHAYMAQGEGSSMNNMHMNAPGNLFTRDQFNQILTLLNKAGVNNTNDNTNAGGNSGPNVAGGNATNHMIHNDKLMLDDTKVGNNGNVQLPTGDTTRVTYTGDCPLSGGDVIRSDLFTGRVKEIGKEQEGLYILLSQVNKTKVRMDSSFAATRSATRTVDPTLWHLRVKSDVAELLKSFLAMVSNQFGKQVKMFRSDNGSEFFKQSCGELFKMHGIIYQSSCPYTPQQNEVVERRHRHILETARAIKFQVCLPDKFWGCCIESATYVLNKIPLSSLEFKSPFEMLYNRTLSLQHMRVIGCLCYATKLPKDDKFSPRAVKAVLLGYGLHQKGYRIFDLVNKICFISRDVVFHELIFPFKNPQNSISDDGIGGSLTSFPLVHITHTSPVTDLASSPHISPAVEDTVLVPITQKMPIPPELDHHAEFNEEVVPPMMDIADQDEYANHYEIVPTAHEQGASRTVRATKPPIWLKDYVTLSNSKQKNGPSVSACSYPLSDVLSYK